MDAIHEGSRRGVPVTLWVEASHARNFILKEHFEAHIHYSCHGCHGLKQSWDLLISFEKEGIRRFRDKLLADLLLRWKKNQRYL